MNLIDRILHCDEGCIVVNKIAGEAVTGTAGSMIDLSQLLASVSLEFPPPGKDPLPLPTAVHRLDVPVCGCTVFARTKTALRFLNNAFANNLVEKKYWAIVEMPGNRLKNEGQMQELIHWIQFNPRKNKSFAFDAPGPGRKKAVLRWRMAGKGKDYLFLEIELITGRTHQIRAQINRLGLHIKGDLKYGAKRSEKNGGIRLHAHSVSFPNPSGDGLISVKCTPALRDNLWAAFEEAIF